MLAILYLAGMIYFGDRICRYFYRFHSTQQRFSTAFFVGLLFSSGITYLGSLAFAWMAQPMIFGNLLFFGVLLLVALRLPAHTPTKYLSGETGRPPGNDTWDWVCLGLCFLFGCWLMWATLSFPQGNFQFGFKSWSDFGANLSVAQSFLLGHNFPSEHPFFPGAALRYHFLFWFQSANFAFLGLSLVTAVNLLSILSWLALIVLIISFTEIIFGSRAVGRLSALLFILTASSLSYIPYIWSKASLVDAWAAIAKTTQFLNSGYPYRGEDWGALTVDIFANQRHLISGVGLLFVVVIFLADFYQYIDSRAIPPEPKSDTDLTPHIAETAAVEPAEVSVEQAQMVAGDAVTEPIREEIRADLPPPERFWSEWKSLVFSGLIIGLLPFWNSAVFVAAFILLGSLWLLFPGRRYLTCLMASAVVVGLPQVLFLRAGNFAQTGQTLFNWGYVISEPTLLKIGQYLIWTFGFKWLVLLVGLYFLGSAHRRFFLAVSSLLAAVFLLQLSTDAFNNHKLLNVWNIFAGIFAAYGLWRIGRRGKFRFALSVVLGLAITLGAFIDLFPVYNDATITIQYKNDRLSNWLLENTKPTDVFLTHPFLTHPILFTGRKTFLGYTLFAWTAGYNVGEREAIYRQIFQERNLNELLRLLKLHNITYIGIDNDLRNNHLVKGVFDDALFQQNFPKVFEDTEMRYANLTIYQVPAQ